MSVYLIQHLGRDNVATWGNASCDNHVYAIGKLPPNYPMPAIRGWNCCTPPHDGGVQGDFLMIGSTYLDWSRGSLEIY